MIGTIWETRPLSFVSIITKQSEEIDDDDDVS
jgi:hypothetical protein